MLTAFAAVLLDVSHAAAGERLLTLQEAVSRALSVHPGVQQGRAEVQAAEARLSSVQSPLDRNPTLEASTGPRIVPDGPRFDANIGLFQPIEVGGQRSARIDAAEANLRAARARLSRSRAEVLAETRKLYAQWVSARFRVGVAQKFVELGRRTVVDVRQQVEDGEASRIDVNTAIVELGQAHQRLAEARRDERAARADLARSIAAEDDASIVPGTRLEELVDAFGPVQALDAATAQALTQRADLVAGRASVEHARASLLLAERSAIPSPVIGAQWVLDNGDNIVLGSVKLELPFFQRNAEERGAARAEVVTQEVKTTALERSVLEQVRAAAARHQDARELARLYEQEVVSAARENVALIREAHAAGKLGFSEVLRAERSAFETQSAWVDAVEELALARADLGLALGEFE